LAQSVFQLSLASAAEAESAAAKPNTAKSITIFFIVISPLVDRYRRHYRAFHTGRSSKRRKLTNPILTNAWQLLN
jgi:hypothetical protein